MHILKCLQIWTFSISTFEDWEKDIWRDDFQTVARMEYFTSVEGSIYVKKCKELLLWDTIKLFISTDFELGGLINLNYKEIHISK